MTRVEDDRDEQRIDDERRAQEAARASQKKASDQFQKLVAQKQAGSRETVVKQAIAQAKAEQKGQAQERSRGSASEALLARRGINPNALIADLQQRTEKSLEKARVEAKGQRERIDKDLDDASDRTENAKQDARVEQRRLETARLAAISGDERQQRETGGGATGGGGGMNMGGQAQSGIAQPAPTTEVAAPHEPRISPELIQELVKSLYAGVNPEGLSMFTIELKADVLSGVRLDVVSDHGKISCTFHTADKNVARLLKASEGPLGRAIASRKGLSLERLEVVER